MTRIALFAQRIGRRLRNRVAGAGGSSAAHDDGARSLAREAFDATYYLTANVDVASAGIDPFDHYFETGWREGRRPNRHFDPRYYLETYLDVAAADQEPLSHYLAHGAAEGRNPSEAFDTTWYLQRHGDVAAAGANPLLHYLASGEAEGRETQRCDQASSAPEASGAAPGAGAPPMFDPRGPSAAAIAAAEAAIDDFAAAEFDLAHLQGRNLAGLTPVLPTEGGLSKAWEKLYLELACRPRRIILAGSLKDNPAAVRLARASVELGGIDGLFVLATDEVSVGRPDELPRGVRWRSLAEFGEGLGSFERSALVMALLHGVRPEAVMVLDSRAGQESLYLRGGPLSKMMRLYVVLEPGSASNPHMSRLFRRCLPYVSAFYSEDDQGLRVLAERFGVPDGALGRLRGLPPPISAIDRDRTQTPPIDAFDVETESWRLFLRALSADAGFLAAQPVLGKVAP